MGLRLIEKPSAQHQLNDGDRDMSWPALPTSDLSDLQEADGLSPRNTETIPSKVVVQPLESQSLSPSTFLSSVEKSVRLQQLLKNASTEVEEEFVQHTKKSGINYKNFFTLTPERGTSPILDLVVSFGGAGCVLKSIGVIAQSVYSLGANPSWSYGLGITGGLLAAATAFWGWIKLENKIFGEQERSAFQGAMRRDPNFYDRALGILEPNNKETLLRAAENPTDPRKILLRAELGNSKDQTTELLRPIEEKPEGR